MKKILAMLLALSLVFAFTACGDEASVEINSLKPSEALSTYVTGEVGYSMDFSYEYDGVAADVKYSALNPSDITRIEYNYESGDKKAAFVKEKIEGAKISLFYHDDGEKKVATEILSDKITTNNDIKQYMISGVVMPASMSEVSMELISEGNMVFTATGATISDFGAIFAQLKDYKDLRKDVSALEYVYTVENSQLKDVTIKGMIDGKEFTATASNFAVLEKGTSLKLADADSYEKQITSDLDALAEEQEAEAEAAAEAATSEEAAGSGATETTAE